MPHEVNVLDVSRNGNDKVESILVNYTFADVEQFGVETCTPKWPRKKQVRNR